MKRRLIYSSIVYLVVVLAFAILFASNFTVYVQYKGDEFFFTLYFLLAVTYVFYFALYFSILKRGLILFIFLPLIVSIISFFLGFIMMFFFGGTPVNIIYIYSITYSYVAVGALVYWFYLRGDLLG
jgi:hypothetical protein